MFTVSAVNLQIVIMGKALECKNGTQNLDVGRHFFKNRVIAQKEVKGKSTNVK